MQHGDIWRGIDLLAEKHGLSTSGLAKLAGLDATAFNKSKRVSADGRLRWPSTESLSRALEAVGDTYRDFAELIDGENGISVPLLEFNEVSAAEQFNQAGHPQGDDWETVRFPGYAVTEGLYSLEVSDADLEPVYRKGDRLIIAPGAQIRSGDRVVVKTRLGNVEAFEMIRQTQDRVTLKALDTRGVSRASTSTDFAWIARILWVSQ